MTYKGGEYSTEQLFLELKRQVKYENIKSFEEYEDLVDSLVEERRGYGFFAEDEDLEQIKQDLRQRWTEIR